MKIILFGKVITTRKRLERTLINTAKTYKNFNDLAFRDLCTIANTGFMGIVVYNTTLNTKHPTYYINIAKKELEESKNN